MAKEVKVIGSKEVKVNHFYFIVLEAIKEGLNPTQICKKYNISKQRLNWYIKALKADFRIKKIDYGVWEIIPEEQRKEVKVTARHGLSRLEAQEVRGHGFQFKLIVPANTRNWLKRREILGSHNIPFKIMANLYGQAEKLQFEGKQVIFTNKSIIVYEPASFYSQLATDARELAINNMRDFIKRLEKFIGANFEDRIRIKVTRQHYALIKNALAIQYNKEKRGLKVFGNDGKLWLYIDNSFQLQELETLHKETADTDNKVIQDFFNDLKRYNPPTNSQLAYLIQGVTQNQVTFDRNMQSHIDAVKKLGSEVGKLSIGLDKLIEIVDKLKNKL